MGRARQVTETKLVAAGATASYYAPTSGSLGSTWTQPGFDDSAWASGPTGLGFVNLVPGFAVTNYKANLGSISSVAASPIGDRQCVEPELDEQRDGRRSSTT